jgi:hypothetical protein
MAATYVEAMRIHSNHQIKDRGTLINLPFLRELTVETTWCFQSFQASNLTFLSLISCSKDFDVGTNEYLFPSLKYLSLSDCSRDPFALIKAPNLNFLWLKRLFSDRWVPEGHVLPKHLNPDALTISESRLHESDIASLILPMTNLQVIEVIRTPLRKSFFNSLRPQKLQVPTGDMDEDENERLQTIFPELLSINVDFSGLELKRTTKATRNPAKKAMKAREKAGYGPVKATLRFTKEEGWIDLLD